MENADYTRLYGPSRAFRFSNASTISTGATYLIDFESEDRASQKYLPFDNIRIINSSSYDVILYVNQDANNTFLIPAGTIFNADSNITPSIRYVKIVNNGSGTITANQISVSVLKEGQKADTIAQGLHQFIFSTKKSMGIVWIQEVY